MIGEQKHVASTVTLTLKSYNPFVSLSESSLSGLIEAEAMIAQEALNLDLKPIQYYKDSVDRIPKPLIQEYEALCDNSTTSSYLAPLSTYSPITEPDDVIDTPTTGKKMTQELVIRCDSIDTYWIQYSYCPKKTGYIF